MKKTSGRDIIEGSIWKSLLLYFFPIWFGSIFQQMYTTVDAVVVGRFVGKEALAALGGTSGLLVDLSVGFLSELRRGPELSFPIAMGQGIGIV